MMNENFAQSRRVLIVDDNEDAATMLSLFVGVSGHETAVANSGKEALSVAATFRPDVVFLDLGMPEMSGYEVAQAMRAMPGLANVYISALTGWHDANTCARVIASGFNHHLVKPADVNKILDIISINGVRPGG